MRVPATRVVYHDQVKKKVMKRWQEILDTGRVILGANTEEFEARMAKYLGRKHAVAVSNDTAALEIAFRMIDIKGKGVILPANGFFSCVTAIDRAGGTAVLVDIDRTRNWNVSLAEIEKIIKSPWGSDIKVVVLMPCGGLATWESANIAEYCAKQGVYVVGDNAHGLGTEVRGKKIGSFEDIACFSFYATKVMNTAEGGMLLFDDDHWDKEARLFRNYGRGGDFGESTIVRDGYNWRMTEFHAALGCEQMKVLDRILSSRWAASTLYSMFWPKKLKGISPVGCKANWYKCMALLPEGVDKQWFKERTELNGVTMSGDVYDRCIHHQPIYWNRWAHLHFPEAEEFCKRHVCMPFAEDTTEEEVRHVVKTIDLALSPVGR